jgi:outer membrane protein insertion porin family
MSFKEDVVMKRSITVEDVVITGLQRTKEEIVLRELADLKRSGTLEEIKDSVLSVHANLMALDIFEAVDISLDNGSSVR